MSGKKPQRRGAFDTWQAGQQAETPIPPPSPLDQMNVARTHQRGREWEKAHRPFSYRGVPADLHEQILALASSLNVNVDEVVQVFVQYGLSSLEKGILTISPRPRAQRMTLFPTPSGWGVQTGWGEADGWEPGAPQVIPARRKTSTSERKNWETFVHYRLPTDVHEAIKQLAGKHTLPVGEVVTLFLKHGLEAYKAGQLRLSPQPKTIRMTLAEATS